MCCARNKHAFQGNFLARWPFPPFLLLLLLLHLRNFLLLFLFWVTTSDRRRGKERMLGGVQEIAFLSPYPAAAAAGLISPGPNSTILPPQAL